MRRRRWGLFFIILTLSFVSFSAWGQDKVKAHRIRIGLPCRCVGFLPMFVAKSGGFYQDEGLDAEIIVVASLVSIQALISGDLDFTSSFALATRAAMTGMPIRGVMAMNKEIGGVLVVKPEIHKMADLKGRVVGVGNPKDAMDVLTRLALRKYGLEPDKDVQVLRLGGSTEMRYNALLAGRIDGALLSMPYNNMAVKMGFKELVFMKEITAFVESGLSTNVRKIQNDPDSVVRTIRAILRAIRFIKENKGETLKVMDKELGIKDGELASSIYEEAYKLYTDTGIPSDALMRQTISLIRETQGITQEASILEVADWSFAQKAIEGLHKMR